jgi:hypothetical protein
MRSLGFRVHAAGNLNGTDERRDHSRIAPGDRHIEPIGEGAVRFVPWRGGSNVPDILKQFSARTSKPSNEGLVAWPRGSGYRYDRDGHRLSRTVQGATGAQVAALEHGECELALVLEEPLLIVCSRFGEVLPWSAAAFSWQQIPRPARVLPQEVDTSGSGTALVASLVEASDDRVVARRIVPLTLPFTRALHEAILEQARFPYDPSHERRALDGLRRRCPGIGGLVANATIRMKAETC